MITATCRTCHQDWTVEALPSAIVVGLVLVVGLDAPCGHGRFVGWRGMALIVPGETEDASVDFRWDWRDMAYEEAWRVYNAHLVARPRPVMPPWDPPPLSMTCACGTVVTLEGENSLDWDDSVEGWGGECPQCGLTFGVVDDDLRQPYNQARHAQYQAALEAWEADCPPTPQPLAVEGLREDAKKEVTSHD